MVPGSLNVILLVHKMKVEFYKNFAQQHKITDKTVIEEVEDLGFGASLLSCTEVDVDNLNLSARSNDASADKIREQTFIIKGMTCSSCSNSIRNYFSKLSGILSCDVNLLTHKALIKYDFEVIKPR